MNCNSNNDFCNNSNCNKDFCNNSSCNKDICNRSQHCSDSDKCKSASDRCKDECIGPQGPRGFPGTVLSFADFYALMPSDNPAPIPAGSDVNFPQIGPSSGTNIISTGPNTFRLSAIGTYQVLFQANVTEPGQLVLTLGNTPIPYTVVGTGLGNTQIVGMAIIKTTSLNSILTVRNATATPLTITNSAGGTNPVSAHLVINQLA